MKDKIIDQLFDLLPHIVTILIILIVGKIVMKLTLKIMSKGLQKSKIEVTAHSFLLSMTKTILQIFFIIILLSSLGIPMASIIAAIGAAGLAIGLALQSSLSNVAGGFIILFSKPFKKGDFVEVGGTQGVVDAISILYTRLVTGDNKVIYIPNGQMSSATIINYNELGTRRLDLVFSIGYDDDFNKSVKIITDVVESNELALKSPAPLVRMISHNASSIDIACRVWVVADEYWTLNFALLETVKSKFDENGISIPYPQMDVHVVQTK